MSRTRKLLLSSLTLFLVSCEESEPDINSQDSGVIQDVRASVAKDSGIAPDSGMADSGFVDAELPDTSFLDASFADAASPEIDSGPLDAGTHQDAGEENKDAETESKDAEAQNKDAESNDAEISDAEVLDATSADASVPNPQNVRRVDAILFREIKTCVIGNPCVSPPCVGLSNDQGVQQVSFADDGAFRAVASSDPSYATAPQSSCIRLVMDDAEATRLRTELLAFAASVERDTQSALVLDLVIHELASVDMNLDRWGAGLWISPWAMRPVVSGLISRQTDFTIVSQAIRDPDTGLHHDLGGCGGTFGGDYGLFGAGHSWVPSTGNAFWFECADRGVYGHEWLHQMHYAVHNLSGFVDQYGTTFPACGIADVDPQLWFPDTHQCAVDPDFAGCGGSCGTNEVVNSHVLSAHYPRQLQLVSNRCRNGVQDFDETQVDQGGACN